jgi:hypothetical protein
MGNLCPKCGSTFIRKHSRGVKVAINALAGCLFLIIAVIVYEMLKYPLETPPRWLLFIGGPVIWASVMLLNHFFGSWQLDETKSN